MLLPSYGVRHLLRRLLLRLGGLESFCKKPTVSAAASVWRKSCFFACLQALHFAARGVIKPSLSLSLHTTMLLGFACKPSSPSSHSRQKSSFNFLLALKTRFLLPLSHGCAECSNSRSSSMCWLSSCWDGVGRKGTKWYVVDRSGLYQAERE